MSPSLHDTVAFASKAVLSEKEQKDVLDQAKMWSTDEWKSLGMRAQDEVVIPQIYRNLEQLPEKPPMWDKIKALYYNTWMHKQNLLSESRRAAHVLSECGVEFLFLKGMVVDSLYKQSWRAMADIDILVKDLDRAEKALFEAGYELDDLWAASNGAFGVANLYCIARKDKIDLHFGEYPVHSLGAFHLPLWERMILNEFPTLSYEDNLLVLVSHVFNHGFYIMRDINDVYVMVQKELDWTYIMQRAKELRLEKPLCALLKAAESVYKIDLDMDCRGSFLYKYGSRKHLFQGLLQPHHLLLFSHVKEFVSYPVFYICSLVFNNESIIDPPWIGRASPAWISRSDRKRLCDMDEHMFHSVCGKNDTVLVGSMKIIFERGVIYVEKQNLQKKDLERAKKIVRGCGQ